ncbi:unnamed protein product [Rangifer tarandus platyrhynchus]|uniref:Uncharacterized protein n=2 Tax=Rangifer tarandus platyrhynchus TaxID=3082113 RepID=A0ABN8Y9H9_RANTA|nr:unnamed protein product [Rangifer tarandus platyrhynchus]CAI9695191.1 unnamed protein product [Rangifer tarandus platyrhynchus]
MPPPASLAARPRRVREAQAFPLLTPTTEVTAGFSPVSGGRNPPFPHSAGRRSLGPHRCAFSSGPKPGVWFCLHSPANLCSYAPKRRKLDVLRCGSRPRLARYLRRRSRPRITGGGGQGLRSGVPNARSGRRGSTGVPDEAGPPRVSVATGSCQALAPRTGYLPFLCGSRGGASRLPGWEGGRPCPRNSQIPPQTKIAGIQLGAPHRAPPPPPRPDIRSVFLQPGFLTPAPLRWERINGVGWGDSNDLGRGH